MLPLQQIPSRMYALHPHTHSPSATRNHNSKLQPRRTEVNNEQISHTLMGARQRLLCSEGSSGAAGRDSAMGPDPIESAPPAGSVAWPGVACTGAARVW